jgi:hypothetical protein
MEQTKTGTGVSGFTLKMVAVISMLIDHSAATILERILIAAQEGQFAYVGEHWMGFYYFYVALRIIGRFAFPIYCYLIVEGFLHTRNVMKYAGRLFLFALLSEVPFDLAFNYSVWDFSYNNVYFTLFLGLAAIALVKLVNDHMTWKGTSAVKNYLYLTLRCIIDMTIIFVFMAVAEFVLNTDYGAAGVAAIALLYLLRRFPKTSFALTVGLLAALCGVIELAALFMVPLRASYNGTRGRQMKYFFYIFYPAHLLILVGICYLMGLA